MSRLLTAGFARLFKNRLFYASIIIMFAVGCISGYTKWSELNDGYWVDLAGELFNYCILVGCSAAVLSSMFSGTEYSDGTIRNKIIAGCNRIDIYLSNLIINIVSGITAVAAFVVPYLAICLLTVGKSEIPTKTLVIYCILSIMALAAFCAIYNAITMLTAKKAVAAVACLLVFALMMFLAMQIYTALEQPEYISGYTMDSSGSVVRGDPEPNRYYLTGIKRTVYEWAYNILPAGQLAQIMSIEVGSPITLACCSVGVMVIVTLAGAVIFTKKDLK